MATPISTLPSAQIVGWNTPDVGLQRIAANVLQVTNGAGTSEWLQQMGQVRTTTSPTNSAATLTTGVLSDLTVTVIAGRKYVGTMCLFANNATGGSGLQFDLGGGSATWTSIEFGFVGVPAGVTVTAASQTSTAIATTIQASVVLTTDTAFLIAIGGVCANAGTLIPRFANNTGGATTATVKLNSWLLLFDSVN